MMMSPMLMPIAEHDAFVVRNAAVAFQHLVLNGDGAGNRVDDAGKFDQQAVAGGLDDASAVGGDGGIDGVLAHGLERAQRADFVGAHQAAVADDVRGQNRRKFALDVLVLCQTVGLHRYFLPEAIVPRENLHGCSKIAEGSRTEHSDQ